MRGTLMAVLVLGVVLGGEQRGLGDEPAREGAPPVESTAEQPKLSEPKFQEPKFQEPTPLPPPAGAQRMNPSARVWVDRTKKQVMVDGVVTLRAGVLEMFACPVGTKEHESIVAVQSPAFLVHAALLSIGAKPGKPVQWTPEFVAPSGDQIAITVQWRTPPTGPAAAASADGPILSCDARQWVRDLRSGKSMKDVWVFAGSGFWREEEGGKEHYLAEGGDMICVSNFGTAMLDVTDPSPQSNASLVYEAFEDRIPPLGTPVRLVLSVAKPAGKTAAAPAAAQP